MTHPAADNPIPRLLALFRHIHEERMAGLPFLNPRLEVDLLEFREREGRWSGLLITPWFINFVVFPTAPDEWAGIEPGTRVKWEIAGRLVEFNFDIEPSIGPYQMHTLLAPVTQFSDQEAARVAALAAWERLFQPAPPAPRPDPPAQAPGGPPRPSRRGFLRGLVGGR